jgi:hypothetical protein
MRRPTYVCATCAEHFARRYSATRHNLTIHGNRGEIVTYLEYLVGRKTGRYQASNSSWYRKGRGEKRIHDFGHATTVVADSMGDTFPPGGLQGQYYHHYHYHYPQHQQQAPSGSISLPSLPPPSTQNVSPYPSNQIIQHIESTKNGGTLSQETMLKIAEFKKLAYRHYSNPDGVIQCVTYFSINGDNTLLDEKLEQLRMLDMAMGYTRI